MATGNETQITPPRVPLTDERTGAVSREWYRWFYSLFTTLGSGTGVVPVTSGGTGLSTIPTNGQLLIGNGTGYSLNTLGTSAGISVTNGLGTIVVANTGVLSFSAGTTGLTPATATTGAVTLAGRLAIANGGTNGTATPTAYGVAYGTGTAYAFTAAGTAKQVLIANTSAAPTWSTLTSGTSILYGDGTGGFSNVTIGSGVSFVAGTLSAAGSGGTVTSVTGTSPVVSSGGNTPAISLAAAYGDTLNPYGTKTATYVLAGPTTGAATAPTFRALVSTDIPSLSYVSSVSATAPITSTGGLTPTIAVTSSALTKTDDTNVTVTLGGSPTTALLAATSLTLGWSGQLAVGRGGTGLSAGTSGGIPYFSSTSTIASSALLTQYGVVYGGGSGAAPVATAAGTTGQVLTATTGGAPTWANPATSGTVTSVNGTGTVNGITLTGTVTTSGSLTLGGTLSGVSLTTQVSGTLPVSNGGSGATTLTGYVKGNGTSAFTAAASVPAADVSGLATVATSGSFSNLSNKPGVQSNGQNVIGASTTLGSGDKGTNILIVTSGITITFPSSGYASGEGVAISNVSGGTVTLSAPGGSDFGAVLLNNGSFLVFCDGGGFWRQYCYSITRL